MMRGLAGLLRGFQNGGDFGHAAKLLGFIKKDPKTGIETLSPSVDYPYGGRSRKSWLYNQMKKVSALPPQIVAPALFDEVAGEIRIPDVLHLDEMIDTKKAKAHWGGPWSGARPAYLPMQHSDIVGNPNIDRPSDPTKAKYVHGFLDSAGNFLDRADAAERAVATGQVTKGELSRNIGAHSPWQNLDSFDMRDMRGEKGWHTLSPTAWENMVEKVGDRDNLKIRMSDHLNIEPNRPSWWQKNRDVFAKKGVQSGLPLIGAFLDVLLSPEKAGAGAVTRDKFTNKEKQRLMEANDELLRKWEMTQGLGSVGPGLFN